jgi:hypothetical protein
MLLETTDLFPTYHPERESEIGINIAGIKQIEA